MKLLKHANIQWHWNNGTNSDSSPTNWAVSLGSVLRSGIGALVIPIQNVIIHPAFNSTNMDYDVALLELAAPAPVSYTIQSVCLPSAVHLFPMNAECYITGWGSTREGGERRRRFSTTSRSLNYLVNGKLVFQGWVCGKVITKKRFLQKIHLWLLKIYAHVYSVYMCCCFVYTYSTVQPQCLPV